VRAKKDRWFVVGTGFFCGSTIARQAWQMIFIVGSEVF
jgi:hypothetical protein